MRRPPRPPGTPVLSRVVIVRTVIAAVLMAAGSIGLFLWEYFHAVELHLPDVVALADAQTMAVTAIVAFQVFYLLNSRSLDHSLLEIGLVSNPAVWIGIAALVVLQAGFIYLPVSNAVFGTHPLALGDAAIAILVGASVLPVISVEKWLRTRASGRQSAVP